MDNDQHTPLICTRKKMNSALRGIANKISVTTNEHALAFWGVSAFTWYITPEENMHTMNCSTAHDLMDDITEGSKPLKDVAVSMSRVATCRAALQLLCRIPCDVMRAMCF
jgi:hypothetical protein